MYNWLNKIIEEQARYYGMSVKEHGEFQREMAVFAEEHFDD